MKKKQLVKMWTKGENDSVLAGIEVRYKRKKWGALDLLECLAKRVEELEENQCVPGAACIFLAEENLYRKGLEVADDIRMKLGLNTQEDFYG